MTAPIEHPAWCSLRRCQAVRTPPGPHRSAVHLVRERFAGRDGAVLVTLALVWAPSWRLGPQVAVQLVGISQIGYQELRLDTVQVLIDALAGMLAAAANDRNFPST
jgi:hypothetical protein